ncbi:ABC transporter substrate-binding protein [Cytobacillus sp. NCCP-133]|uniref:ABC transporter substrate-binding protein n=1 Tax=Cytobacillus sp. NCCP-133 TaxID=766848 RepID=UPI0022323CE2|nr:iron-siderophore ABC transporter substrate-binding protein [Cytobacillus sp. NCCP-133]GLB60910.1 staphyloferrin B ABC transporter substrate-binding protein SirA [Cytobacillus sp. NCCP-133]
MSGITYSFEKKYSFSLLAIILSLVMFLAGCGSQSSGGTSKDNKEAEQTEQKEAAAPESEGSREITHAMGTTTIKGTPKRIVTLYQGATDVAVAFGVKPVGAVESWVEQPVYEYLRADLEGVQNVGLETQPNLEEIAKLKPDLIIASKLRHEKIYDQLSQIAPTVTHETVFKFKETVDLMGNALNKEKAANKLVSDWDGRVADFKEKITAKMGDKWPVEVSILNFREDHSRIYITGFAGDILSELGFERPEFQQQEAEKGTVVLKLTDKESIPNMNADVFFVFNFDDTSGDAVKKSFEEWTNHPLWKDLDAAKNNQVYMVNEISWNNGGGIIAANNMLDDLYTHFELEK